jgi:hypothetical protein
MPCLKDSHYAQGNNASCFSVNADKTFDFIHKFRTVFFGKMLQKLAAELVTKNRTALKEFNKAQ